MCLETDQLDPVWFRLLNNIDDRSTIKKRFKFKAFDHITKIDKVARQDDDKETMLV